jgi:hypothetical protein
MIFLAEQGESLLSVTIITHRGCHNAAMRMNRALRAPALSSTRIKAPSLVATPEVGGCRRWDALSRWSSQPRADWGDGGRTASARP